jgi:hypothetical protein
MDFIRGPNPHHLRYEHMFMAEIRGLEAAAQRHVALSSSYRFITRYRIPDGWRQILEYSKHVRGHITVFPNKVQAVTKSAPHITLQIMDETHVPWQDVKTLRLIDL